MLIIFLKRHSWRFAICSLLSVAVAIGITSMLAKQWPATMLFQVGQVGGQASPILLADPNNIVQRVKFPGFVLQVLAAQNLPADPSASERGSLVKASLAASLAKGGSLVELSVQGYSREEATENLRAAFKIIEYEHGQLLAPSMIRLKKNLDDITIALKKIEDERQAILEPINKARDSNNIDKKFSESILLASMMKSNDSEARNLRDQKTALEEQLSPYRTFNTKAVTPTYTPQNSIFPKRSVSAILGLFLGMLIAAIWAMRQDQELRVAVRGFFK